MKKLTLLILCIATLGLASCKKDTIINQTTPNRTIIFTANPGDWVLEGNQYYLDLDASDEIDNVTLNQDGTLVYTSNNNGVNYYQLPYGEFDYEVHVGGISISSDNRPSTQIKIKLVIVTSEDFS